MAVAIIAPGEQCWGAMLGELKDERNAALNLELAGCLTAVTGNAV